MPITRTIMTDDDGSGTTGTILNNAWLQTIYGQIDTLVGGWQAIPFNAADFSGTGGMTWTLAAGNLPVHRYAVIGTTLFLTTYIAGGVIGGTLGPTLLVKLPRTVAGGTAATSQCYDGIHQPGFVAVQAGGTHLMIQKIQETAFSAGVSYIRFSVTLELA